MSIRISQAQQRYASIQGFIEALRRLDAADGVRPTYTALTEALFWAVTIEDDLSREDWYEERRAASEHWPFMPGVRYARNFATHQVVALAEHVGGVTFPMSFPMSFPPKQTIWLAFEELPEPEKRSKYTPMQQESYRTHLAGKPTLEALVTVQEWLRSVQDVALPGR